MSREATDAAKEHGGRLKNIQAHKQSTECVNLRFHKKWDAKTACTRFRSPLKKDKLTKHVVLDVSGGNWFDC